MTTNLKIIQYNQKEAKNDKNGNPPDPKRLPKSIPEDIKSFQARRKLKIEKRKLPNMVPNPKPAKIANTAQLLHECPTKHASLSFLQNTIFLIVQDKNVGLFFKSP